VGARFANVLVSEFNARNLPVRSFVFPGNVTVTSPDPGRALITGNAADANFFKIPTLWGVKNTAPYFHDNSAATLDAVAEHYNQFLIAASAGAIFFSAQDKADLVAFMKLL
jgi:cytochrome c peroxidase